MATLRNGGCYLSSSVVTNNKGETTRTTGVWSYATFHAGDPITIYGGKLLEAKEVPVDKRSHARIIPGTAHSYVYDGYNMATNTTFLNSKHPADSNVVCIVPEIDDITNKYNTTVILDGGLGYWINSAGKRERPNVCVRWCPFDKQGILPMECVIVALTHIPPHTQLLCKYNNNDERNGFL